ncbi:MAG: hypothetical protein KGJ00_06180 [Bradyrhizobium sp.]|nr:hypothetical protein [Bradyrhizobium sp.]
MNLTKTITAAAILSASIAGPAFAQDAGNVDNVGAARGSYVGPVPHGRYGREARLQRFYHSYNQVGPAVVVPPPTSQAYQNLEGFGFTGRDPSRVGGYNPNLNPSGS